MKIRILAVSLSVLVFASAALGAGAPPNWKNWDRYPDVPRYTPDRVQQLLLAGEKMVFIYAGYEASKIVCGSMYIPYTTVPPYDDGSKVNLNIPKDTWMVAYCP